MKNKPYKIHRKIVGYLLVLSLILTTGTFAYWANYVEGTNNEITETLTVGSAKSVKSRFDIANELHSGGRLVPSNQVENSEANAVAKIDLAYNIAWLEDSNVTQLNGTSTMGLIGISHSLIIVVNGEELDSSVYPKIFELINVNYDVNNKTQLVFKGESETFFFSVTMDEPENQREYLLIRNASITIEFTFSIHDSLIETTNNTDDDLEPASPYGDTLSEIAPSIINDMQEKLSSTGSYGRSWGKYRYTDLGLDPENWDEAIMHIHYKPSGSSLFLRPEDGYGFTVYNFDNDEFSLDSTYNWNLIYSDIDGNWYFHSITESNIIDINTLVVESITD